VSPHDGVVKRNLIDSPEAATGTKLAANDNLPGFEDKRAVGAMAGGMSVRWVDGQLMKGMPHLKLGPRRVRFDMEEVRAWLKQKYATQRHGPALKETAKAKPAA